MNALQYDFNYGWMMRMRFNGNINNNIIFNSGQNAVV